MASPLKNPYLSSHHSKDITAVASIHIGQKRKDASFGASFSCIITILYIVDYFW